MSHELMYTSVPPGVIPGAKGYCTVARSADFPNRLLQLLEQSLSDYRYSTQGNPPVVWSHLRVRDGMREFSALTRKTPVNDHSGRPSVFAHHVVLGPDEQPSGGPAWVLGRPRPDLAPPEFLLSAWDGTVGTIAASRVPLGGDRGPRRCVAWESAGIDPGWAGALAEAFLASPDRPAYLIAPPNLDVLPLFEDAIALLPPSRRWALTFCTYFTGLPPNLSCAWRVVLPGSAEQQQAVRLDRGIVLDLSSPGEPPHGDLVELARTGVLSASVEDRLAAAAATTTATSRIRHVPIRRREAEVEQLLQLDEDDDEEDEQSGAGRQIAFISAIGAGILLLGGFIVWQAGNDETLVRGREEHDRIQQELQDSAPAAGPSVPMPPPELTKAEPAPAPPPELTTAAPEPPPETPAPTESEPAIDDIREHRVANVALPKAAIRPVEHDGSPAELNAPLPEAKRYALRLLGLDDPELSEHFLVSRSDEEKEGIPSLLVIYDENKGGSVRKNTVDRSLVLGRFWIDDHRLHFQWAPPRKLSDEPARKLPDKLDGPSHALRDCFLEIRGNGVQLTLALRQLLVDSEGMLIGGKPRELSWASVGGRPVRDLVIIQCEVKTTAGWEEVPQTDELTRRQVTLGQMIGAWPAETPLLIVKLNDQINLTSNLGETAKKLPADIGLLRSKLSSLQSDLDGNKRKIESNNEMLASLARGSSQLGVEMQEIQASLKTLEASGQIPQIQEQISNHKRRMELLNENMNMFREKLTLGNTRNAELLSQEPILEQKVERLRVQVRDSEAFLSQLDPYVNAPVRVKLGVKIEGQTIEVARIGPWDE